MYNYMDLYKMRIETFVIKLIILDIFVLGPILQNLNILIILRCRKIISIINNKKNFNLK